jgi:hypothetical protein
MEERFARASALGTTYCTILLVRQHDIVHTVQYEIARVLFYYIFQ